MLAFWTGRDPDRIDRIFRSSGLYREKWDRDDYRDRTTGEAVAGCHETYLPSRTRGASGVTVMQEPPVIAVPRSEPADAPTRESPSPKRRLSAIPLASISMRSIEWLEKPLWQTSAFQLLAGTKGSGKGTYLAGLASRVSLTGSNVLIVSSEDSAEIDTKPRLVAAGAAIDRCEAHRRRVRRPRQRHPHRPR